MYLSMTLQLIGLVLYSVFSHAAPLANICQGTVQSPCIVFDNQNADDPIRAYRSALGINHFPITEGPRIEPLYISASASPSLGGWLEVKELIESQHVPIDEILILDLRQESHLYINGRSVTHAVTNNWINVGLDTNAVLKREQTWLDELEQLSIIDNALSTQQFRDEQFDAGISIEVEDINNEKQVVEKLGMHYLRLPIQDHCSPDPEVVDKFVTLINQLPATTWVHAHCRGGKGRSTSIIAMYDMLKNAGQLSFEQHINRQKNNPPYYDLLETNRGIPELVPCYEKRAKFIERFYQFSLARKNGFEGNWSDWLGQNADEH